MPHFVYIARCNDDSLYTGTCIDLKAREAKHNAGEGAKYTRSRLPVRFVYHETLATLGAARSREAAIKRLPREGKLQLIGASVRLFPMTKKKGRTKAATDITLRDVVVHMEKMEQRFTSDLKSMEERMTSDMAHMESRLASKIEKNTEDIQANSVVLHHLDQRLTGRIDSLEDNLTIRIDALEEDLTATMKDTYAVRKHIGLVTADDE